MGHLLVKKSVRKLAVRLLQASHTYAEAAEALGTGFATVNRAWREFRETGEVTEPRRRGGRSRSINEKGGKRLKLLVESMPDATYDELTAAWNRQSKLKASRSAVIRKSLKLGFTGKKKSKQASEKTSKKFRAKRATFRFFRKSLDPQNLVFIDEAGFQCKLSRSHARSLLGCRAAAYEPDATSKKFTITGAIRLSGPVVMQGDARTMTKKRFFSFLRRYLLPRLHPGDVIVMDNLAAYRNKIVRRICRAWDIRVVYLPSYSPEYNPIEKVWSWMEKQTTRASESSCKLLSICRGGSVAQGSKSKNGNLFRGCGYLRSCKSI